MDVQIKIQGVDVIKDVLNHLPPAMQKRTLRPSMKSAMKVVKKNVEVNIDSVTSDESTGLLRKSIRIYNLKIKRGILRTAVMVKRGQVYPGKFYRGAPLRVGMVAGILEYGKRNQTPRSPFRKAIRESGGQVFNALQEAIKKNLEKALNAAKRKQA